MSKFRPSLDGATKAQILSREMAHAYLSGTTIANRRNARKSTSQRTLSMSLGLATAKRFAKTSAPGDLIMQNKPNFAKA